jgi:hypothetical protein
MAEGLRGYSYPNPGAQERAGFQVVPTDLSKEDAGHLPGEYQSIILEAWAEQFSGLFTPEQIRQTADPHNPKLVANQKARIKNTNPADRPTYVHALILLPKPVTQEEDHWIPVGIGKGKYADSRPRWQRIISSYTPPEDRLADISDVFVRPTFLHGRVSMHGKGFGSAILRSLLDAYPDDMPTVVYDYEINERLQPVLANLGFQAVEGSTRPVELFGTKVQQTRYDGPARGDLVERLEARRPWLRDRQPIAG